MKKIHLTTYDCSNIDDSAGNIVFVNLSSFESLQDALCHGLETQSTVSITSDGVELGDFWFCGDDILACR